MYFDQRYTTVASIKSKRYEIEKMLTKHQTLRRMYEVCMNASVQYFEYHYNS